MSRTKRVRGKAAVMANRAPQTVIDDDPVIARYRTLDFFPTPPWAARAGGELIRKLDPDARSCWEPACGEGHMAEALREYFDPGKLLCSDIHDYGTKRGYTQWDFLSGRIPGLSGVDWIVTNPPFKCAVEFLDTALSIANRGVALLCRLAFLEGGEISGRYERLFQGSYPLTQCAVFSERVPMMLGRWEDDGRSATAYAWFLFSKNHRTMTVRAELIAIPPGTKARLTHNGDARYFAAKVDAPLFDAATVPRDKRWVDGYVPPPASSSEAVGIK